MLSLEDWTGRTNCIPDTIFRVYYLKLPPHAWHTQSMQRSAERTLTIFPGGLGYKEELRVCIEAVNGGDGGGWPGGGGAKCSVTKADQYLQIHFRHET
jgi:hypothetical protein